VRATQGIFAQQVKQPNKNASIAMILNPDEIPGGDWTTYLKRDIPVHAFDAKDPIKIRVKDFHYTTSRRSFKKPPTSRLIFIEVTPLANSADAESWAMSASFRQESKLSELEDISDFEVFDYFDLQNVDVSRGFSFAANRPKGILKTLALAASIENIFMLIACSDFDRPWTVEEFIEVGNAQVEKIRTFKNELPG
jgi:hypothetical protein